MARRRPDLERDIARVADPFAQAAKMWSASERRRGAPPTAAGRRRAQRRERETIMAVGRHAIAGDSGLHPVTPVAAETLWAPSPEYHVDLRGRIREEPPPPPSPRKESVLDFLERRRRELYGERYQHVPRHRPAPVADAEYMAREQAAKRESRRREEARRPPERRARAPAPGSEQRAHEGEGVPYRALTSRGAPIDAASLERDVRAIVRRPVAERDRIVLAALVSGPVGEVSFASSETKRDVLARLNQKYQVDVSDPPQMLAYLRSAADYVAARGSRRPGRLDELASDHKRLRLAPLDL